LKIKHIMKKNKKFIYLLFLAGIIIIFSGCRTSRLTTAVALTKMSKDERIESIKYQAIPFNTISSSMRFSIKTGIDKGTTTANARLRIIKDNTIQLSILMPILGIEMARVTVTPEQIIILDKNNGRYFSESMQTLQKETSFDFDFYSLQALFTNQLFITGKSSISPEDHKSFNWSEDEFFTKLNNTDKQGINYDFTSDFTYRIIQTEMYKDKKDVNLNWLYKDFGLTSNNKLFPMKMMMELKVPDDMYTLNLNFNNVDIDSDFQIDTSIPNKYQRINIEQVAKLIQSL